MLLRARIDGQLAGDPFDLVGEVSRPRHLAEPHAIWPESVVETVIEAAIVRRRSGIARAVAIARYVGARRGDLVTIARAARDGGRVRFLSGKRRVQVDVPEDPALAPWLTVTPETQPLTRWQQRARAKATVRTLPKLTLV